MVYHNSARDNRISPGIVGTEQKYLILSNLLYQKRQRILINTLEYKAVRM